MENPILSKKRLLWIITGVGVFIAYAFMLTSDLNLSIRKKEKEIGEVSLQGVSIWKKLGEGKVLKLFVEKMIRSNSSVGGEGIRLILLQKGEKPILEISGKEGKCDFQKGEILLKGGVFGNFKELQWESDALFWKVSSNRVESKGKVRFWTGKWRGVASLMVIDINGSFFKFSDKVEIVSTGGAEN